MNVDFTPKHLYFLWVVWKLSGGLWCTGTDATWVEPMISWQSCLCFVSDTSLPVKCCGAVHGAALGVMLTAAMFLLITMHKHMHEQTNNNMETDTIPPPYSWSFCSSGILNPLDYIWEKWSNPGVPNPAPVIDCPAKFSSNSNQTQQSLIFKRS